MIAKHIRQIAAHPLDMIILVGFVTGLALVAPVGPVALTLFGLGAERGRRAALAGAGGVVLADLVSMPVALASASALQRVDPAALRVLETVMGVALAAIGLVTLVAAGRARSAVAAIRRPVPTLAAMTLVNPLSMTAWAGLALALPASWRVPGTLVLFGAGLVAASAVWHTSLAVASGTFASRLGERTRSLVTRVSGAVLVSVGLTLLL